MSVRWFVSLLVSLSVCLSVCLSVHLSVYLSVYLSVCLSFFRFVFLTGPLALSHPIFFSLYASPPSDALISNQFSSPCAMRTSPCYEDLPPLYFHSRMLWITLTRTFLFVLSWRNALPCFLAPFSPRFFSRLSGFRWSLVDITFRCICECKICDQPKSIPGWWVSLSDTYIN